MGINEDVARIIARSHSTYLRTLATTERALLGVYRDAANDIGNIILSAGRGVDVSQLKGFMGQIEARVAELNRTGNVIVQGHIESTVRMGIVAQEQAMSLAFPAGFKAQAFAAAFDRLYHDAVLSLMHSPTGISLSQRIWNLNQTSLGVMRRILLRSMMGGMSSADVYRQLKATLLLPDVDMRTRFWRQYFRENPPGRGVYRSAWKNVQRVLRTESNRAFREAASIYAKDKIWAVGVRWTLSAAHPEWDICLAGWEQVETASGLRAIATVRPGEMVLTHTGKMRRVVRSMSRTILDEEIVILACRTEQDRIRTLALTPNHPVLSDSGWIPAGMLQRGDQVVDVHDEHDEPEHLLTHDVSGRASRDSLESEPCLGKGNGAVARYDEGRPELHTAGIDSRSGRGPIGLRLGDTGVRVGLVSHLANSGFLLQSEQETCVSERLMTGGTTRGDVCRSWDSSRPLSGGISWNSGSVLLRRTESRRTSRTSGRSSVLPHGVLGSMPRNRRDVFRMLCGRTVVGTLHTLTRLGYSGKAQSTHENRSACRLTELGVREAEESVFRTVRNRSSYVNYSVRRGKWQTVEVVEKIVVEEMQVFNLEVEGDNSYVASGIPVHNCDLLASRDNGLGPGIYRPGEAPDSGHPHCLCYLTTVVDEQYLSTAVGL